VALTSREKELLSQPVENPIDINSVIDRASHRDPDRHAKVMGLARDRNVPPVIAESETDELERRQKVEAIDPSGYGPGLTALLKDYDKASITLDDLDNLDATEKELSRGSVGWQMSRIGSDLKMMGGSFAAGVPDIGASIFDMAATIEDAIGLGTTGPLADMGVIDRNYLGEEAAKARRFAARSRQATGDLLVGETEGMAKSAISGGLRSVPASMYGLLIGAATGNPNAGLGFMGASAGSQATSEAREQGLGMLSSLAHGSTHGIVEYATERMPMIKMFEDFGVSASLVKKMAGQMATEIPGEQIATGLQDLADHVNLPENAEKTFSEYMADRPNAALQTLISTVVATGVQTGIVHTADRLVNGKPASDAELTQARRVMASQSDQEKLDTLIELAQSSKTSARSQDLYQEFLRESAGDMVIYLPEDIASTLPDAPDFITDKITGVGADIEMPVDWFMYEIASNKDLMTELRPHIKLNVDGMTAEEIDSGGDAEVKSIIERAQAAVDEKTEISEINDAVYRQLKDTRRQPEQEARVNASMITSRVKSASERYDLTPNEIMERMNMNIQGPQDASPADDATIVLDQAREAGYKGDDVSEAGEWQDAVNKGLDMSTEARMDRAKAMGFDVDEPLYHGTGRSSGFDEFKPEMTGGGADQYGGGFYLSTSPTDASGYAMDATRAKGSIEADSPGVIPLYSRMKKYIDVNAEQQNHLGDVIDLDADQVREMLDKSDALKRGIDDADMNPLGDHFDSFWETGPEDWMLDELAETYKGNPDTIEVELFDNDPAAFRAALSEVTGFDGIRVNFTDGKAHLISWKPEHLRSVNAAFDPDKADSPKLLAQSSQSFGDLKLTEEVEVEGTGQTVTISESAQRVFDQTVKRRDMVRKLKDCLNA
jgi:hypothetical protein